MEVVRVDEPGPLRHRLLLYPLIHYYNELSGIVNYAQFAIQQIKTNPETCNQLFQDLIDERDDITDREKEAMLWVVDEIRQGTPVADLEEEIENMQKAVTAIYPWPVSNGNFRNPGGEWLALAPVDSRV